MKRLFMLLIVMVFGLGLVGCNSNDKVEFNSEKIKQDLVLYVNSKVTIGTVKGNIYLAVNLINDEIEKKSANEYNESNEKIMKEIKEEIDNLFLETEKENEICNDWKNTYGTNFYYTEFYGKYEDKYVFFVEGDSQVVKDVIISNTVFRYNCGWEIYVWCDNVFYSLTNAYNDELINNEDLKKIESIHFYKTNSRWKNETRFSKENYYNIDQNK